MEPTTKTMSQERFVGFEAKRGSPLKVPRLSELRPRRANYCGYFFGRFSATGAPAISTVESWYVRFQAVVP